MGETTTLFAYDADRLPGTLLAFIDESEDYEIDQTAILADGSRFALATATGCSCWDGYWDVEYFSTLEELFTSLTKEYRQYNPTLAGVETLRQQVESSLNA